MYRVLLVDDDPDILRVITSYLGKKKIYEVFCAKDAEQALTIASRISLDAIVLDVDLPGMNGVNACRRLRESSRVPVLFLSAYAKTDDRIRGLLAGGDDYIAKPYNLQELELRIRLRIERYRNIETAETMEFGRLKIDLGMRQVTYDKKTVEFSSLEFDLLAFLARHPGQVFSYEQLYDRVWKEPIHKGLHNLQMCVARVRQKLEKVSPNQNYIETIRRKGYRFNRRSPEMEDSEV